jgi:hypothetical protein
LIPLINDVKCVAEYKLVIPTADTNILRLQGSDNYAYPRIVRRDGYSGQVIMSSFGWDRKFYVAMIYSYVSEKAVLASVLV